MRTFKKDKLVAKVMEDDKRCALYLANGWKEVIEVADKEPSKIEKAVKDIKDNTVGAIDGLVKKTKEALSSKKVNDTLKANDKAEKNEQVVDDGLVKKTKEEIK